MVNKVPWTVLRKNLEKRISEQDEKLERAEKATESILKTINDSKFKTKLNKDNEFNDISENLHLINLIITELISSEETNKLKIVTTQEVACQTESFNSSTINQETQTSYEQGNVDQSKIEEKSDVTPELPLSENIDEEMSFMDILNPMRTSSPFKDKIILNTQQSVIVVEDTLSPRLTPKLDRTESTRDISIISNRMMLSLEMESWEDTSLLDTAIHVDFNITISLVKELQELVNIRVKLDNIESEKHSLDLPEYLEKPKEIRNLIKEMKINKYVSLLMKKSVKEKGRLAELKPTSRKRKRGKCERVGMNDEEYELITDKQNEHGNTQQP